MAANDFNISKFNLRKSYIAEIGISRGCCFKVFCCLALLVSFLIIPILSFAQADSEEAFASNVAESEVQEIVLPEVNEASLTKLRDALAVRHNVYSKERLVGIAGSEAALIASLIELKAEGDSSLPHVPYRAAKILLGYTSYAVVKDDIEKDLSSPNRRGLAQIVAINIDKVSDLSFRRHIARMALTEAQGDENFMPFAKTLVESSDSEVREIGKEALR